MRTKETQTVILELTEDEVEALRHAILAETWLSKEQGAPDSYLEMVGKLGKKIKQKSTHSTLDS